MGTGYFFDFKKVPVPLFPMQEIVLAQKEGYRQILDNTKEIHSTLTTLNQQNREYKLFLLYSHDELPQCFSDIQG